MSRRAPSVQRLMVLTAITVGLAAIVGIGGGRPPPPARPLVVPGLRFEDVTALDLALADHPPLGIVLDRTPQIIAPAPAAVDERAVRDLVSAIASARFDRVGAGAATGLARPAAVLRLHRAAGIVELKVGAAVPASGQTWLAAGGRVGLVPSWVADAIVRDPDSLRRRQVFPAAPAITAVEIHGGGLELLLADQPLHRRDAGTRVALDPARRDRFLDRLGALTIAIAVDAPLGPPGLTVRVLGGSAPATLTESGPCPGQPSLRLVQTLDGAGCVAADALDELAALARELAGADAIAAAPIERFDRTTVASLAAGGVMVEPDGAGWRLAIGDHRVPADAALMRDVAAALTTLATRAPLTAADEARLAAAETWRLRRPTGDAETWAVDRAGPRVTLRREREPVLLVLDAQAAAAVRLIGPGLRDRSLLAVDPVSVAGVEATGAAPAAVVRGALIGEWNVTAPAGARPTPAIDALRDRLADLRAAAWPAGATLGPVRRTLRITAGAGPDDPAGRTVTIEVGAARAGGCLARVDGGDVASLAPADCDALLAALVTRR